MIQISGSSGREHVDMNQGGYEDLDQYNAAKPLGQGGLPCEQGRRSADCCRAPSGLPFRDALVAFTWMSWDPALGRICG